MSIWWKINIVLISVIVLYGLYELFVRIMMRRSAKIISQEEFQAGMRKAQVIDVRERDEFNAKHILGARSFPYTMLKETHSSLRKDQPIFIYDHNKSISARAANLLRKKGTRICIFLKAECKNGPEKLSRKRMIN